MQARAGRRLQFQAGAHGTTTSPSKVSVTVSGLPLTECRGSPVELCVAARASCRTCAQLAQVRERDLREETGGLGSLDRQTPGEVGCQRRLVAA
jgi:hypothetical protein